MAIQTLLNGESNLDHRTKLNENFSELYDSIRPGILDYNDTATQAVPISIPGTNTYVPLTNDGLGAYTNKTYAPPGVSDVWDVSNNRFDWSELSLGDSINIRIDFDLITATNNTQIKCSLIMSEGTPSEYEIPFILPVNFKTSGTYTLTTQNGIYFGNAETLN